MIALYLLAGLLLLLGVVLLLRAGVAARYDEGGAAVSARLGPLRFRLYPEKPKKPKKEKKPKKPKEPAAPQEKKGGALADFRPLLAPGLEALGRFRRRLRVDRLALEVTVGAEDPAFAAEAYGYACAALGGLLALLENALDVRERDVRAAVDFDAAAPRVRAELALSIRVGAALRIGLALFGAYRRVKKGQTARPEPEAPAAEQK